MKKTLSLLLLMVPFCALAQTPNSSSSESVLASVEETAELAFNQLLSQELRTNLGAEFNSSIKKLIENVTFETRNLNLTALTYRNQENRWLQEGVAEGWVLNQEDRYLETLTPDDSLAFAPEPRKKIEGPITTTAGEIELNFGTTQSDQVHADQPIDTLLIRSLKEILEETNKHLVATGAPPITSIHISATTNGKHSTNSNHYKGMAVDISRINGVRMIRHNYSLILYMTEFQRLNTPDPGIRNDLKNKDLVLLYQRILQLQASMQNFVERRENFGPFLKTKHFRQNGTNNFTYEVGGHKDHIHFSVR